jgi:hypothetical protein
MRLSWNEIRARAAAFAAEWAGEGYEKGEAQTFYNDFFEVFGVRRRSVARFEKHVQKLDNTSGFIDLFWPGVLLVEQKSAGRDLAKAYGQAGEYFDALKEAQRPRYILVSDFQTFDLYDLDERESVSFKLEELPRHIDKFGFILGVQKRTFRDQDPVNIAAAELVGKLHDALEESGYTGHDLERFLVRLVFCLFADDTGVFEPRDIFLELLETRTGEDGSDLGGWLAKLFEVLDTPEDKRSKNLDEDLAQFPYVNGDLFKGATRIPDFNGKMRMALIEASRFDWSPISPAIFGSLFQSVMNREERRQSGAHYTTEKNILKVIGPLFLDDLRAEFDKLAALRTNRAARLREFQEKLSRLRFLDPACGCGNFLVIAYRELRLLEIEVLQAIFEGKDQLVLDVSALSMIDVDQFAGIEIGEFASRIAETAMWMMDHIMNARLSLAFGKSYVRIPLTKSPVIRHADALAIDWASVLPPEQCTHVLGNPPFVGHQWRDDDQQEGMHRVWGRDGQVNRLDYVTCWFKLAVEYAAENPSIRIAFVATNSICQGEQAGILWPRLAPSGAKRFFAHRTFQWMSEARGKAAVHCVIVGLAFGEQTRLRIFEYDGLKGDPHEIEVSNINPYLVDASDILIPARRRTPAGRLPMFKGSQPTDGARIKLPEGGYETFSNLVLGPSDREEFLAADPAAEKWLKPFIGGDELISGEERWCLWLKVAKPSDIAASAAIRERLERVKKGRLKSPTASVRTFAKYPALFTQDRQPTSRYLAIPEVSSERRFYIPMALLEPSVIASNKLQIVPGAGLDLFALLTSAMHMGWMRTVAGRLKSDYSYSPTVYYSFPWPVIDEKAALALDRSGQSILDARLRFPNETLERLYDPDTMPAALQEAHEANDRLVDRLYSKTSFDSEHARVKHLFQLYEASASPIEAIASRPTKRRRRSAAK